MLTGHGFNSRPPGLGAAVRRHCFMEAAVGIEFAIDVLFVCMECAGYRVHELVMAMERHLPGAYLCCLIDTFPSVVSALSGYIVWLSSRGIKFSCWLRSGTMVLSLLCIAWINEVGFLLVRYSIRLVALLSPGG